MNAPLPAAPGGAASGLAALKTTRILVPFIFVLFVLSKIFHLDYLFALQPGYTIPHLYHLVTAGLFEHQIVGLVTSTAGLLFFGRLFEPVWGSKEYFKFILVVSLFASVCTFVVAIVLYYITGYAPLLYTKISGLHGVLAGFVVAVKQIYPEFDVLSSIPNVGKLRAKWLPVVLVLLAVVVGILVDPIQYVPYILFGTYGSWIYLRYYQRRSESIVAGDPSAEFAFRTFFPEQAWPLVDPVATWLDKLCCGKRGQQLGGDQGEESTPGSNPLPGSDSAEAARRRERGARALEERLIVSTAPTPKEEV
jgi:membrane associated rhomboid family serine protease